jgi:hypothetical protein
MKNVKIIWGVKDVWHKGINGEKQPEVRSDNPCFNKPSEFFQWIYQHGGTNKDAYVVSKELK